MSKLTKAEQKWVHDLQEVLDKCPSKRLGFYTIGDDSVYLYDRKVFDKLDESQRLIDLVRVVDNHSLGFDDYLSFPAHVEGVCG